MAKRLCLALTQDSFVSLQLPTTRNGIAQPGSAVLAKTRANGKQYWAAQVMSYLPPAGSSRKGKKGRYELEFFDGEIRRVPRDWFFSERQDDYLTCEVSLHPSGERLNRAGQTDRPTCT